MRRIIVAFFLSVILLQSEAQVSNTDSIVQKSIEDSEKLLFESRFDDALEMVSPVQFTNNESFAMRHEMLLTIQELRIRGIVNIVRNLRSQPKENLARLSEYQSVVLELEDQNQQGIYHRALASAYRSTRKPDSAQIFEDKAVANFTDAENFELLAEMRASEISRRHNRLLRDGKKEEILKMIPEYQEEIEYSEQHSKYALAYNTRHLAQIHRRQTHNYPEAIRLFKISLDLRKEIGFTPFIPASYSSLGDVFHAMGECEKTKEMYEKAALLAEEIGFLRYQVYPFIQVGDCYLNQKNHPKAFEYYEKAMDAATSINYYEGIDEVMKKVSKIER